MVQVNRPSKFAAHKAHATQKLSQFHISILMSDAAVYSPYEKIFTPSGLPQGPTKKGQAPEA